MGDQILCVVWCSSVIICGSFCDGNLCIGQIKFVPIAPVMENLEAENHHHQVLQLEPLEVWNHMDLVSVLGYVVFLPLLVIHIIMLFISLVKLWILFLCMVGILDVVDGV